MIDAKEDTKMSNRRGGHAVKGKKGYQRKYPEGLYGSRIYNVWSGMKQRCYDDKTPTYPRYGGRGIKVCDRWEGSFQNFYDDMNKTYQEHLTIERIDNDGDYTPDNCRWATRTEQANNRRSSRFVTINGETKTLASWIKQSGIKQSTVAMRLTKYKWSITKALGMED